jgi:alkanesulfonate monooxygenase SsuD/methylene tetrahydromethanopterin reductase-like flavin-dependent oxidoreductase (luciferase family)
VGRDEESIGKSWSPEVLVRESEAEIRTLVEAGRGSIWGEEFESWAAGNLVGTPEQVAEKVARYVELGCSYFIPWCTDYPDLTSLSLFAERVMPEFR